MLPGKPVADIGCDHGKLTAVLAASGKIPPGHQADRARPAGKTLTLEHAGCKDRVELRLGDGLSVSAGECEDHCAGGRFGTDHLVINRQARGCRGVGGPRLVMVPATRHSELRRWLWEHGFALAADRPVQAAGRWYAVMAAESTPAGVPPTFASACSAEQPNGPRVQDMPPGRRPNSPVSGWACGWDGAGREIDKLLDGSPSQTR